MADSIVPYFTLMSIITVTIVVSYTLLKVMELSRTIRQLDDKPCGVDEETVKHLIGHASKQFTAGVKDMVDSTPKKAGSDNEGLGDDDDFPRVNDLSQFFMRNKFDEDDEDDDDKPPTLTSLTSVSSTKLAPRPRRAKRVDTDENDGQDADGEDGLENKEDREDHEDREDREDHEDREDREEREGRDDRDDREDRGSVQPETRAKPVRRRKKVSSL